MKLLIVISCDTEIIVTSTGQKWLPLGDSPHCTVVNWRSNPAPPAFLRIAILSVRLQHNFLLPKTVLKSPYDFTKIKYPHLLLFFLEVLHVCLTDMDSAT